MATDTLHSDVRRRARQSHLGRLSRGLVCLAALAGGLAVARPAAVHAAATVVGSGTASSCTTNDASPNDGPVTIADNLTITRDLTIDGTGQQVTIDGGGGGSVIAITGGPFTLNLTALTIGHGHLSP